MHSKLLSLLLSLAKEKGDDRDELSLKLLLGKQLREGLERLDLAGLDLLGGLLQDERALLLKDLDALAPHAEAPTR